MFRLLAGCLLLSFSLIAQGAVPNAPTGLVATTATPSKVNLSWSGSATLFKIESSFGTSPWVQIATTPNLVFQAARLTPGTQYRFRVRGNNVSGDGLYSSTATATTTPDTAAPTVPTRPKVTSPQCEQALVVWGGSTDEDSNVVAYRVYRDNALVRTVAPPSASVVDTGLVNDTSYNYTVSAVDTYGNESIQSLTGSFVPTLCPGNPTGGDVIPPSTPTGVVATPATAPSCGRITLTWNVASDNVAVIGYKVYRNGSLIGTSSTTTYLDTLLMASTSYSYRVSAYDNRANESGQSTAVIGMTPACADVTAPSVPTGLAVVVTGTRCNSMDLTWNASTDLGSGVMFYYVYRNNVFLRRVTVAHTTDATLPVAVATTYSYKVVAVDNAGNQSAPTSPVSATTPSCYLAKGYGGASSDFSSTVVVDRSDNSIIVGGYFVGTVNFGSGPLTASGASDTFVLKYTSTGALSWAKQLGSTGTESVQSLAVDSSGNIFVTGSFSGTGDFGGGAIASLGGNDIFLAKYSSAGAYQWQKRVGGTNDDLAARVAVTSAGEPVLCGTFRSTANFGGDNFSSPYNGIDMFLAKYSSVGVHQWSKNFTSTADDYATCVAVDSSNNILLTGYFIDQINLGGNQLVAVNATDAFVAKFNSSGTHVWSRSLGGFYADRGIGVVADTSGNAVVCGLFYYQCDFGAGLVTTTASYDFFLAKYASNDGAYLWAKPYGGRFLEWPSDLTIDTNGNLIVAGYYQNSTNLGGNAIVTAGSNDAFVAKFDENGTHVWSEGFGGTGDDSASGVSVDSSSRVSVTGRFSNSAVFHGSTITSNGAFDGFLIRLQ